MKETKITDYTKNERDQLLTKVASGVLDQSRGNRDAKGELVC